MQMTRTRVVYVIFILSVYTDCGIMHYSPTSSVESGTRRSAITVYVAHFSIRNLGTYFKPARAPRIHLDLATASYYPGVIKHF